MVNPIDNALLHFYFLPDPGQGDVDAALAAVDIEVLGATKALLLAYVMARNSELDFGAVAPRLKGLLRFYRFSNLRALSHLPVMHEILNMCTDSFFPVGDLALKALRPALPRPLPRLDFYAKNLDSRVCADKAARYGLAVKDEKMGGVTFLKDGEIVARVWKNFLGHGPDDPFWDAILTEKKERRICGSPLATPDALGLYYLTLAQAGAWFENHEENHALFFSITDAAYLAHAFLSAGLRADEKWIATYAQSGRKFLRNAAGDHLLLFADQ